MFFPKWSTDSWHHYTCLQMPFYPYQSAAVKDISSKISLFPPLVSIEKINHLKEALLQVSARQSFLLHGGNCAETFEQATGDYIARQISMMHILASHVEKSLFKTVVPIARLAGQFGKPRTNMMQDDVLNYFGDIVNRISPSLEGRKPKPENMLQAYEHSKTMIGFLEEHHPSSCFLSHEAFLLPFEAALTRVNEETNRWYNLGTHFPWLGKRSLYLGSPHIEYMRGIQNPIGIKLSHDLSADLIVDIIQCLNPHNEEARIVLIPRFGVEHVKINLPRYLQTIEKAKLKVIWIVDPMHGNTIQTSQGRKFRSTQHILTEVLMSKEIHEKYGSYLGGIHLECANEPILECADRLEDIDPSIPYTSAMDPRLNLQQATELINAFIKSI